MIRYLICALFIVATLLAQEEHGYTPADIERGGQIFLSSCASCHGPDANAIPGFDLSSGHFRHAASDDELVKIIQNGIPGTAMPPSNNSDRDASRLVAFLRMMSKSGASRLPGGDAARGKTIVEGSGNCLNCHRIQGRGGFLGPDLSAMGSSRRTEELERALLEPNADIRLDNRVVRLVGSDGNQVRARLLNQDTYRLMAIDNNGQLISRSKSDLRQFEILGSSPMPDYESRLSQEQLADIVAYLKTLKGNAQ